MEKLNHHNSCIQCGSREATILKGYEKHHLVKCHQCGLVFSKQIPTDEELEQYYAAHYDRTNYFSPITKKRYNELLDEFEKFRQTGRILDIGCGYGFFLETAKQRGWEVYGTELSADAEACCKTKGILTFRGELPNNVFEKESFDVIVAIEVIEHLRDPLAYVKEIQLLLRKGGLVYLTTPNFNAYLRYRLKATYDVIEYPNHLCYFTSESLKRLFEQEGFQTKQIQTTGMSVTRYRTSTGKSNQEFVSETSDDEMIRYRIERNSSLRMLKNLANTVLNTCGIGLSLKGYFLKN